MQKTLHCFLLNKFYFPGCLQAYCCLFILVGPVYMSFALHLTHILYSRSVQLYVTS